MVLSKEKLEKMAERYEKRAVTAFDNYQQTGIQRYDRERHNFEDLADALRMAADAHEDHTRMIEYKGTLANLGFKAATLLDESDVTKLVKLAEEVVAAARIHGLV